MCKKWCSEASERIKELLVVWHPGTYHITLFAQYPCLYRRYLSPFDQCKRFLFYINANIKLYRCIYHPQRINKNLLKLLGWLMFTCHIEDFHHYAHHFCQISTLRALLHFLPFSCYRETRNKENVTFLSDDEEISYTSPQLFVFDPEMSVGDPTKDSITTINIPFLVSPLTLWFHLQPAV